jgi:hypothetical protein
MGENNKLHANPVFPAGSPQGIHLENYRMAFDAMRAYHVSEIEHKKDMVSILNGILVSIVTVYAGIFVFILSDATKFDSTAKYIAFWGIFVMAGLYWGLLHRLMRECANKIKGDNNRYEKFRNECTIEREILGLQEYYKSNHTVKDLYWQKIPETTGKKKKQAAIGGMHWLKKKISVAKKTKANFRRRRRIWNYRWHKRLVYWGIKSSVKKESLREGTGYVKTIAIIRVYSNILTAIVIVLSLISSAMLYNQIAHIVKMENTIPADQQTSNRQSYRQEH